MLTKLLHINFLGIEFIDDYRPNSCSIRSRSTYNGLSLNRKILGQNVK